MAGAKKNKAQDTAKDTTTDTEAPGNMTTTPPKKNKPVDPPKDLDDLKDTDDEESPPTEPTLPDNSSTPNTPGKSNSKQSTLHVKKRPKLAKANFNRSPRKFKSPDKLVTRALTTVLTRDGAIIAEINFADGNLCFNKHIVDWIKDDRDTARIDHGIDCVMVARDPSDPTKVYTQESNRRGKDVTKLRNLFININYANNKSVKYRNSWGNHLVDLHNAPRFQKQLFGTNNRAFFAGDLTPTKGEPPYMSEFLTIKHTIGMIDVSFAEQDLDGLIADNAVLCQYFPTDMFQQVREYYHGIYKKEQAQAAANQDDDLVDDAIPTFKP